MSRSGLFSLFAHGLLIGLLIWQPQFRVKLPPVEIPAEIELNLGSGATKDGAPPTATPQTTPQPTPPVPKVESSKEQPAAEAGDLALPPPPQPQAPPAPPQTAASPKSEVNLGDGFIAPPAIFDNPIEHVEAAADPNNVAPIYPLEAAMRKEQGDVLVAMYIDSTGKVANVEVLKSSGSASLDRATIEAISRWHFRPAFHEGMAVPSVRQQLVSYHG